MRTLRLVATAMVLAALSTIGASAAQAGEQAPRYVAQNDGWQW